MPSFPPSFELRIDRQRRLVSAVRRLVEGVCERVVTDADELFRISMTTHELLENAMKYGADGPVRVSVHVEPRGSEAVALVRVANLARPENVGKLESTLAKLDAARAGGTLAAHYEAALVAELGDATASGVGLARIAAEGGMHLELEMRDGWATVSARGLVKVSTP
jgi:hypothetical protein